MALNQLIRRDEAVLAGVVLTELLRGARTAVQRSTILEVIEGVAYLEMTVEVWRRAGEIAGQLDAKGTPIPLPDMIVAAIALEGDHEVLTRDEHFNRIPNLRLYDWKDPADA
jgi:tRNA(fMet)-specific endonuclease VapC